MTEDSLCTLRFESEKEMAASTAIHEGSIAKRRSFGVAYTSLVLFMLVYCARPEDWIPGVGHVPLAKIVGAIVIIAGLFSLGQSRLRLPREASYLVLLTGCLWLSVPFSPVWKGGAFAQAFEFTKVVPVIFVMVFALRSLPRFRRLIFVQTACVVIISAVSIWKAHVYIGRLEGVLNGNYSNSNDLATQIVICLPFCAIFMLRAPSLLKKLMWGFAIILMSYAVLLTGSRGGFLAWAVVMAVCVWRLGIQGRRRGLLVLGLLGVFLVSVAGGEVSKRFGVITSKQDNAVAYASAQSRKQLFLRAVAETVKHPLFGIGVGNFPVVSGNWHEDHNIITELSAEAGIPAAILLIMIVWRSFSNLRRVERIEQRKSERMMWAQGLYASLLGLLVATFLSPDAYQYFVYFFLFYPTALLLISREQQRVLAAKKAKDKSLVRNEELNGRQVDPEFQWSSL
jgi:O-antigen ligase